MAPGMEMPFIIQPLDGAEVTLFNTTNSAVFQTKTAGGGHYSFDAVGAGSWQIVAQKENYYPQMGMLRLEEGGTTTYDLALTSKGTVTPGEGFIVSGTLKDSATGAGIPNATINLYADTGYWGIMTDVMPPSPGTGSGGGSTEPGVPTAEPSKPASMMPLWDPGYYKPQNQTTITAADGSFSFPIEINGYSLYLDYHAEGYLAGNTYQDITGRTEDLTLSLTMDPLIATGVHGHVADASGTPVAGAHVEFIFGNGWGGGGIAVPGFAEFDDFAKDGEANFDSGTGPVPSQESPTAPPPAPGDWDSAPTAGGGAATPDDGGSTDDSNSFDNEFMQRWLWEQQQKGASAVPADFSGYVSVTTDANGDYSVADIPVGHYYVMVNAYKHLPYAGEAELVANPDTNVLDVVLPVIPVGSVEGTVRDETGAPMPDTLVNATQPFVDPFTYTDSTGHYRIDNVPAGEWIISAFKSGHLTASQTTQITENGVATVNLVMQSFEAPDKTTVNYGGAVLNGSDNSGVVGADVVFTPNEAELGGYARHIQSGELGTYSTTLVPNADYNVLVQETGYEDLFFRFWVDEFNPRMDLWLWPIGATGGRGGWNGGGVPPPMPMPGDPTTTNPDEPVGA
jgi:hypothetical protein